MIRSSMWNAVAAVAVLAMAVGCLALTLGSAPIGVRVLSGAATLVLLAGAGRVLTTGVRGTSDALIVRELFRTVRLPWSAVRGARLVTHRPQTFGSPSLPTPMPELRYVDGAGRQRRIFVTSLGSRRVAVAQRHVEALNELIRAHGSGSA